MTRRAALAIVVLFTCIGSSGHAAQITEIKLGGPRNVRAVISNEDGHYQIAVSFIPVRCFDAALNAQLTQEKAADYARVAIGRHLLGDAKGAIAVNVRDAEITDSRIEEQRAVVTVRFPKDGLVVKHLASSDKPFAELEKPGNFESANSGDLLTAKSDQLATVRLLVDVLRAQMPPLPERRTDAGRFYRAIADYEQLGDTRFNQFRSEVQSDALLLTIERDDIVRAIKAAEDEILKELKHRVDSFASGPEAELQKKFAHVDIDERFRRYLAANPLLMEVTGAKIIRISKKKAAILAVASTALTDDSAEERLRAQRVCKVKALASVIAEKQGVQLARIERVKDKTQIVIDDSGEKATSVSELLEVTQSKVHGMAKDMPVIGTWTSKNSEVFYLAIGSVVDISEFWQDDKH